MSQQRRIEDPDSMKRKIKARLQGSFPLRVVHGVNSSCNSLSLGTRDDLAGDAVKRLCRRYEDEEAA